MDGRTRRADPFDDVEEGTMSNVQRFIDGIEAVNGRDWARQRSLLAHNMTYIDHGSGTVLMGADAFVSAQRTGYEPFPDQHLRITAIAETGSTVLAELVAEGTHTQAMRLPTGGSIPATDKRFTVHIGVVTEYAADGLATDCRVYSNPVELMSQLGIAPAIPRQVTLESPARVTT
jgi:limonene-1,2-epoxide hydrolase